MSEYIDREAAKKKHCDICRESNICYCSNSCADLKIFDSIPAADVRPVVRGQWIEAFIKDGVIGEVKTLTCSACGYTYGEIFHNPLYIFCPNCGARMEES